MKKIFLLIILSLSCDDPFATREPETPKTMQSSWIQPTIPEYVIVNFQNAIKEQNKTNYLRCLADTSSAPLEFVFIAEPSVANAHPTLFQHWTKESENIYINQLLLYLDADSTFQLNLLPTQPTVYDQDKAIMVYDYALTINHSNTETACPREMAGQCEFRLIQNQENQWSIYQWQDYATRAISTWSELKAYFGK